MDGCGGEALCIPLAEEWQISIISWDLRAFLDCSARRAEV